MDEEAVRGRSMSWRWSATWQLVIAFVAVVVWRWREPLVRCLAVTGAVFALLSLGNHLTVAGRDTGVPGPVPAAQPAATVRPAAADPARRGVLRPLDGAELGHGHRW